MVNEIPYIILEQPIKALVNSDTLDVYIDGERYDFCDLDYVVYNDNKYASVDEIIIEIKKLHILDENWDHNCRKNECIIEREKFATILGKLKLEILKAVSM